MARANWAQDMVDAHEMRRMAQEIEGRSYARRCSVPIAGPAGPKCTLDAGHERVTEWHPVAEPHECNVARDIEGL